MRNQQIISIVLGSALLLAAASSVFSQEATKLFTLSEASTEKLLEDEGEKVRVVGFVEATNTNQTGIHFLSFKDSEFQCVTFARYIRAFKDGAPADTYKDKWLEVTGTMENYRGKPQFKLTDPKQVKILDRAAPTKPIVVSESGKGEEPGKSTLSDEKSEEDKAPGEIKPIVAETNEKKAPVAEVVDGVPAIDWRQYFPSGKK